jgi:hypothetical protein
MCTIDWNALAALSTGAIAVLTLLTLRRINKYVKDTSALVKLTEDQMEAQIAPFLAVVTPDPTVYGDNDNTIVNHGRGPALNVTYRPNSNGTGELIQLFKPIEVQGKRSIHELDGRWQRESGFELQYESLSGTSYQTLFYWDAAQTAFITKYHGNGRGK